jgi:hypothetical protein
MSATTAVAAALPIPQRATGSHFYRYSEFTGPRREWLKNIILDHRLYVPDLSQLNDPADGRPKIARMDEEQLFAFFYYGREGVLKRNPHMSLEAQIIEVVILNTSLKRHGAEVFMRGTVEAFYKELDDWRIYCLCKRSDNMSMWAKYASNHSGYCLEFANVGPFFGTAFEVTYGDSAPLHLANRENMDGRWFARKTREWSGEEEIRVLVPRHSPAETKIEPEWLTRLILGWKMPKADRAEIRALAKQRSPELKVVEASWDCLDHVLKIGN